MKRHAMFFVSLAVVVAMLMLIIPPPFVAEAVTSPADTRTELAKAKREVAAYHTLLVWMRLKESMAVANSAKERAICQRAIVAHTEQMEVRKDKDVLYRDRQDIWHKVTSEAERLSLAAVSQ